MPKNVGVVAIPAEYVIDKNITPDDLKGRLLLPEGVRPYKYYEDWYRQTFNIMLISDEPVKDTTFPTEAGCEAPSSEFEYKGNYILVGERRQ